MWLEQTIWIWAPVACAALIYIMARLTALGREVLSLHRLIIELEQAGSANGLNTADRPRNVA